MFITCDLMAQSVIVGEPITSGTYVEYIDSNHPAISMSLNSPSAGIPLQPASNSDLFLRVSYYINNGQHWGRNNSTIQVSISSGSVPPGTILTATIAPCTSINSGGALGNTVSYPVTLSTTNQSLVTNMGNCYTGTGNMDGYQITFALQPPTNYGQIVAGTYSVTVMFTAN